MKNFIQHGDMITINTPAGGLASGQGVLVGNLFGIATKAAAQDESVEIATIGVYELPKLVTAVIGAAARVAWDDTAKQVVLPGVGMVPIGTAAIAAGNGVAIVRVRLDGVATAPAS